MVPFPIQTQQCSARGLWVPRYPPGASLPGQLQRERESSHSQRVCSRTSAMCRDILAATTPPSTPAQVPSPTERERCLSLQVVSPQGGMLFLRAVSRPIEQGPATRPPLVSFHPRSGSRERPWSPCFGQGFPACLVRIHWDLFRGFTFKNTVLLGLRGAAASVRAAILKLFDEKLV